MAKFQSPLLGYNNNVRHRGRLFHIQTEDSGVNHPHIITHLFMDGGRILKSVKQSYAEHVGSDNMSDTVRGLMKDQHKGMIVALKDGKFDELVDGGAKKASGAVAAPAVAPKPAPPAEAAAAAAPPVEAAAAPPAEPGAKPRVATLPPPYGYGAEPPLPPELEALLRDELPPPDPPQPPLAAADAEPATTREPSQHLPAQELTLDFDEIERESAVSPVFHPSSILPPPPKNLFSKELRAAGVYSARESEARVETTGKPSAQEIKKSASLRPPASRPPPSRSPTPSRPPPSQQRSRDVRTASPRPASAASSKPRAPSAFDDDLVTDKSLDEVILSYLAEDLDPPPRE